MADSRAAQLESFSRQKWDDYNNTRLLNRTITAEILYQLWKLNGCGPKVLTYGRFFKE